MTTNRTFEELWSSVIEKDALIIDEETRCGCLVLYKWGKIIEKKSEIDFFSGKKAQLSVFESDVLPKSDAFNSLT